MSPGCDAAAQLWVDMPSLSFRPSSLFCSPGADSYRRPGTASSPKLCRALSMVWRAGGSQEHLCAAGSGCGGTWEALCVASIDARVLIKSPLCVSSCSGHWVPLCARLAQVPALGEGPGSPQTASVTEPLQQLGARLCGVGWANSHRQLRTRDCPCLWPGMQGRPPPRDPRGTHKEGPGLSKVSLGTCFPLSLGGAPCRPGGSLERSCTSPHQLCLAPLS